MKKEINEGTNLPSVETKGNIFNRLRRYLKSLFTIKVDIDKLDLDDMIELGFGATGGVYKYKGKALKVLNESGIIMSDVHMEDEIVGQENDTFVFPSQVIRDKEGTIRGFLMELVEGEGFITDEAIKKIPIPELIKAIQNFEQDLRQISERGIITNDMNEKNLMWDHKNNRIRVIDTDGYIVNKQHPVDEIYKYNLRTFNLIIEAELGVFDDSRFYRIRQDPKFVKLYKDYCIRQLSGEIVCVNELITSLVDIAAEMYERKFETLQDIEQYMRKNGDWENETLLEKEQEQEYDIEELLRQFETGEIETSAENDIIEENITAQETGDDEEER